jgi:hypothetical protein
MPPQEQTKCNNTATTVLAHGTIATESTPAIAARVTAATVRCALHPKVTSRLWAADRDTGGHHPFMVAAPRSTPTIEEQERGSPAVEPLTTGTAISRSVTGRLHLSTDQIHHCQH